MTEDTENKEVSLVGLTKKEIKDSLRKLDIPDQQLNMRVNQIWGWVYNKGINSIDEMTTLSLDLREELKKYHNLERPQISDEQISKDGTKKWLLKFNDGSEVETVFIPDDERGTLCVSSQVGCTLNCTFCHTGTQRLVRNLTSQEIVSQIIIAKDSLSEWGQEPRQITNIVMMGMGEPLYNFESVRDGILTMSDDAGLSISKRKITLSTSGIVPKIKMAGDEIGSMLAISLHATNNDLRNEIVPINKKYPIEELLEACRNYPGLSNSKRITFEYVMLKGVNDSEAEARDLVKLISGIPAKINLIPFNSWPGSSYECSDWEQIEKFGDIVNRGGYASPIRTPRGEDISAACGQLKSDTKKVRASEKYKKELAKIESKRIGRL
ncbi:MAG: 23S rRNA (adenine(2503)-C(2))-methyltransferase RlmN [Hyphomicrobiales bacterium]|jgi:23S rRNA (adenine2503-C2)-methyltransferase|nr:23S rRNA (adenine(2503)-C(2))-methyltransferase RlmN [Candidatus Neomarinimicrobiota bacterium]|tara:strand:- start:1584 stop:2726 length:1143 start_codon:yes stop_codon:yes gene_type:complete